VHIAVMYAQSRSMPAPQLTPSHAINKGRRYRYYVSVALITEAGTDRAQSRRIVARVLGTRPECLSKGGAGLCPVDPVIRLRIAASSNADVLEPDGDRLAVRNYLYPYARVTPGPLRLVYRKSFASSSETDWLLEESGFEPSVPLLRKFLPGCCRKEIPERLAGVPY
jgi:hypothetical protein